MLRRCINMACKQTSLPPSPGLVAHMPAAVFVLMLPVFKDPLAYCNPQHDQKDLEGLTRPGIVTMPPSKPSRVPVDTSNQGKQSRHGIKPCHHNLQANTTCKPAASAGKDQQESMYRRRGVAAVAVCRIEPQSPKPC
jgi:hypothetical protein